MVFALSGYRYISLFAEKWHPIVRVIVCPVETRCSRLLPDRVQYNIHLLSPFFESGFSGLQRTSLFWVQWSFVKDYLVPFFSPMRNASARVFDMKAPFKIIFRIKPETLSLILKILIQTNGCCARNFLRRLGRWLFFGNVSCKLF